MNYWFSKIIRKNFICLAKWDSFVKYSWLDAYLIIKYLLSISKYIPIIITKENGNGMDDLI